MQGFRITTLLALSVLLAGCGGSYFVGFVSNPIGSTSITGKVTSISSGFASSASTGTTSVTVVTFTNFGSATTLYFCGDQKTLFPLDQTVRAEYTSGILCAVLVKVVVMT